MSDEDALLAAVVADPASSLPRLAYADWLDDRGDAARAELVRLEVHLVAAPADDAALVRFRDLAAGCDPGWLSRFVRPEVARCGLRFNFACTNRWDALEPTALPTERFCGECDQFVTLSLGRVEAMRRARAGQCVAVDRRLVNPADLPTADDGRMLIAGAIIPTLPPGPPGPHVTVGTFATADDRQSGLIARLGWLIRRRQQ